MDKVTALLTTISLIFAHFPTVAPLPPEKHIVCIDPGHGGDDPGAEYNDLTESNISLSIAKKLQTILRQNNVEVVMTRSDNSPTLSNSDRAVICNQNHADILISIHLNANTDSSMDYTQGLYGVESKDKSLTTLLHQTLLTKLHVPDPPEDAVTDFGDNTLLKAKMPATLQETVFISSDAEYDGLKNGTREDEIAQALSEGISDWFAKK